MRPQTWSMRLLAAALACHTVPRRRLVRASRATRLAAALAYYTVPRRRLVRASRATRLAAALACYTVPRRRLVRASRATRLAAALAWLCLASSAAAQAGGGSPARAPALPHAVATWSAGIPLRLATHEQLDQSAFAPAYVDLLGGYVLAGHGRIRHGAGLGLSLNLSEDGGFTEPVRIYEQFVIMPSYLMLVDLGPKLFGLGHAGIPINVHRGTSFGFEAAFALGYHLLSGWGAFAEAGVDTFVGTGATLDPLLSLEAGIFFDYEVLP